MPRRKSTHVDDPARVGARVKAARLRAGLSQRQLAFAGCSPAYISRVEAGERTPSLRVLAELGERLGVSGDVLATGQEDPARLIGEAELALRFDDADEATSLFEQVRASSEDPDVRSRAMEGLAQVALRGGDPAQAVVLFKQALDLTGEEAPARPTLAEGLARAQAAIGELPAAIALLERCATFHEADALQFVRFSALLGFVLTDNGNFAEAERVVAKALDRSRDLADPYARARLLWSDFRLKAEEGQSAEAEESAHRALAILRELEDEHALALLHQALAHIAIDRGRPEEAIEQLEAGRPLMERTGTPLEVAQFKLEEARTLSLLGEPERAVGLAAELTQALGTTNSIDTGRAYVLLGEIWETAEDLPRARELYELAIEILEARRPTRYLVKAYKQLAGVLKAMNRRDEAFELLERAVAVQDRAGRFLV